MWVVNEGEGLIKSRLYAYTLATGARDTDQEFDLVSNNTVPKGIWSDGTTMWVVQDQGFGVSKIYAYQLK